MKSIIYAALLVMISGCLQDEGPGDSVIAEELPSVGKEAAEDGTLAEPEVATYDPPEDCPIGLTDEQTDGPYYRTGSPEKNNITGAGIPGAPIIITGYVYDDKCSLVAGTWLDFWQADGNGNYDNEGYTLRGHQYTDENGRYFLRTVYPGAYPGRTNHIHVKLRADADVVTTQLYFPGAGQNNADSIFDSSMVVSPGNASEVYYHNFKIERG